jgi:hypothetical protein
VLSLGRSPARRDAEAVCALSEKQSLLRANLERQRKRRDALHAEVALYAAAAAAAAAAPEERGGGRCRARRRAVR